MPVTGIQPKGPHGRRYGNAFGLAVHSAVVDILDKIKAAGIGSKGGQALLHEAKQTLKMFAGEMEQTSAAALNFFEQYWAGGSGIDFARGRDFGALCAKLSQRICQEENILYAEYEKLKQ